MVVRGEERADGFLFGAAGEIVVCESLAESEAGGFGLGVDEPWSVSQLTTGTTRTTANKWFPVSNGENGSLSSASAPLFASLFPERDRHCHLMVHENSDDGQVLRKPLGYREGRPLSGVMTLQNFIDGGYDAIDAKILVVVKSVGAKKTSESS